jgi:hypothetical protein
LYREPEVEKENVVHHAESAKEIQSLEGVSEDSKNREERIREKNRNNVQRQVNTNREQQEVRREPEYEVSSQSDIFTLDSKKFKSISCKRSTRLQKRFSQVIKCKIVGFNFLAKRRKVRKKKALTRRKVYTPIELSGKHLLDNLI